jgi:hypothetical protein
LIRVYFVERNMNFSIAMIFVPDNDQSESNSILFSALQDKRRVSKKNKKNKKTNLSSFSLLMYFTLSCNKFFRVVFENKWKISGKKKRMIARAYTETLFLMKIETRSRPIGEIADPCLWTWIGKKTFRNERLYFKK